MTDLPPTPTTLAASGQELAWDLTAGRRGRHTTWRWAAATGHGEARRVELVGVTEDHEARW